MITRRQRLVPFALLAVAYKDSFMYCMQLLWTSSYKNMFLCSYVKFSNKLWGWGKKIGEIGLCQSPRWFIVRNRY